MTVFFIFRRFFVVVVLFQICLIFLPCLLVFTHFLRYHLSILLIVWKILILHIWWLFCLDFLKMSSCHCTALHILHFFFAGLVGFYCEFTVYNFIRKCCVASVEGDLQFAPARGPQGFPRSSHFSPSFSFGHSRASWWCIFSTWPQCRQFYCCNS